MSSRQEEKEQRRQERMAAEAAEAKAAGRLRRLQLVFGGVLAALLIAAIGFAVLGVGGDDKASSTSTSAKSGDLDGQPRAPEAVATIPAAGEESDPDKAAEAAGCDLIHAKYEGAGHEDKEFKPADYQTNPPSSGTHNPVWYEDGVYDPGETDTLGMTVHTLEHGRIDVQYAPGTSAATVKQLESFLAEKTGYHMLLFQNETDMPYAVAATAWTQVLGCKEMSPKVFDAMRAFYDRYVDKGPEQVP